MSAIDDYWKALDRLKRNESIYLPKGTSINNDTVALEAGRKRGTIKKSRKGFSRLLIAINDASKLTKNNQPNNNEKLLKERTKKVDYRERYHQALNRELMLLDRLAELEKKMERYNNVVHIMKGG